MGECDWCDWGARGEGGTTGVRRSGPENFGLGIVGKCDGFGVSRELRWFGSMRPHAIAGGNLCAPARK